MPKTPKKSTWKDLPVYLTSRVLEGLFRGVILLLVVGLVLTAAVVATGGFQHARKLALSYVEPIADGVYGAEQNTRYDAIDRPAAATAGGSSRLPEFGVRRRETCVVVRQESGSPDDAE